VDAQNYEVYRETLGGLTNENELTVRMKLQQMGILPGAGRTFALPSSSMEIDQN
jgi:hypothetical protein